MLDLSLNDLTGTLPSELGLMAYLQNLFLSWNNIDVTSTLGTQVVIVECNLQYAFFMDEEANVRMPTHEEIDGLIVQTNLFYLQNLMVIHPNMVGFEADVIEWTYDETREYFLFIDFHANGFFTNGTEMPAVPVLLADMQGLDYDKYIMFNVWNSEPGGSVFADTKAVVFFASSPNYT